jgi:hypothetical protein
MKTDSVADFVANTMDEILKSAEHKAIFGTQYKFAEDENDAKCPKCSCAKKDCTCADDNDAKATSDGASDCSMVDDNDAKKKKESTDGSSDCSMAEDDNDAVSEGTKVSSAFDIAIDSLLTASAAMDSLGFDNGSTVILKVASFVVDAKKKEVKKAPKSKSSKSDSSKSSKTDSNAAKDKAAKEKEKAAKEKAKEKAAKDAQAAKDKLAKEKAKEKEKAAKEKASKSSSSKK